MLIVTKATMVGSLNKKNIPTEARTANIVFLKMWLSHIAGRESQIESSVQRMRFSAISPGFRNAKIVSSKFLTTVEI